MKIFIVKSMIMIRIFNIIIIFIDIILIYHRGKSKKKNSSLFFYWKKTMFKMIYNVVILPCNKYHKFSHDSIVFGWTIPDKKLFELVYHLVSDIFRLFFFCKIYGSFFFTSTSRDIRKPNYFFCHQSMKWWV